MSSGSQEVTQLLVDWGNGDQAALERLLPLVNNELRKLARRYMRRENPGHSLETSALVNEAYLRLIDQHHVQWQNRAHFFGIAAQLMRRVLVEHARNRNRAKRGGDWQRVSFDAAAEMGRAGEPDLIALDDALSDLARMDPQQSRIVELRYFGGLTIEETAEVLGISHSTVERDWGLARAWLRRELGK